jgi:hypothetical protein
MQEIIMIHGISQYIDIPRFMNTSLEAGMPSIRKYNLKHVSFQLQSIMNGRAVWQEIESERRIFSS